MQEFSQWLAATAASDRIRDIAWIIPLVQSVHIMAISVVLASSLLLGLRLMGVVGRDEPIRRYVHRHVPWLAVALMVLMLSGATLIIGEPDRTLHNWVFWTKMALVGTGVILTGIVVSTVRHEIYHASVSIADAGGLQRKQQSFALKISPLDRWIALLAPFRRRRRDARKIRRAMGTWASALYLLIDDIPDLGQRERRRPGMQFLPRAQMKVALHGVCYLNDLLPTLGSGHGDSPVSSLP
jgi:hypothetical protein